MKKAKVGIIFLFIVVIGFFSFKNTYRQHNEPWTPEQLMEPAALAAILNNPAARQPVIYNIGFSGGVKNSIGEGPVKENVNLAKWKKQLQDLPRSTNIVIYCGCCPFEHCPNIRPAFTLLNQMGFTNQKLLNLPHNIKVDWFDKGYPQ